MGKQVYVLYSCDSWKMRDSMRLIGVFSRFKKLQRSVRKLVSKKDFKCQENHASCRKCTICSDVKTINDMVEFCYIEEVLLNEMV